MIGIYKITNKVNGKVYIGQSVNIANRWKQHRKTPYNPNDKSYDLPLYRAIRKYSLDNFSFEVIEECTIEELDSKEIYWIKYYNSTNTEKGYNLKEGGNYCQPTNAKLSEQDVLIIKERLQKGEAQESIAEDFPVTRTTISQINLGKEYVHNDWTYPLFKRDFIKNRCIDCGKIVSQKGVIRCQECYKKYRENDTSYIPINKEELKQLIRTTPFTTIAKQYGVTDNAVRKWCKKYQLPFRKIDINSYSNAEWELI